MKYQAVAFDVDGTLLDSVEMSIRITAEAYTILTGEAITFDEVAFVRHTSNRQMLERLQILDREEEFATIARKIGKEYRLQQKLFPGAKELLIQCREQGRYLALISNRNDEQLFQDPILQEILPLVNLAVSAETTSASKPDPAPMKYFLQQAGVRPEESFYLGDSRGDAVASRAAGMPFALALWDCEEMIDADFRFANIADLMAFLRDDL